MSVLARRPALPVLLALALAPAGCSDGDDPTDPGVDGPARLNVMITDAPGDVAAAWLQIDRVYLQGGDGPVDLLGEPTELIEITELVGTALLLAEEVEVAPGAYGQLRFVVGGGVLESDDGNVYVLGDAEHPDGLPATGDLQCPSCAQSGLKVILPGDEMDLEAGETTLVLDFDVSQSFGHKAGNSGKWVMHPTMHGSWIEGDPVLGPAITGTVALAEGVTIPTCPAGTARSLEDFVPVATATTVVGDDAALLVQTGTTGLDGAFLLGPLVPDVWTLDYLGTLELEGGDLVFEATVAPGSVTVGDAAVAGVSYTITSASCVGA